MLSYKKLRLFSKAQQKTLVLLLGNKTKVLELLDSVDVRSLKLLFNKANISQVFKLCNDMSFEDLVFFLDLILKEPFILDVFIAAQTYDTFFWGFVSFTRFFYRTDFSKNTSFFEIFLTYLKFLFLFNPLFFLFYCLIVDLKSILLNNSNFFFDLLFRYIEAYGFNNEFFVTYYNKQRISFSISMFFSWPKNKLFKFIFRVLSFPFDFFFSVLSFLIFFPVKYILFLFYSVFFLRFQS